MVLRGLLQPAFLPESRGDAKAESFTHADRIVGHFLVHPGERVEATLKAAATQLVIAEAKLGSGLSSGVRNAPGFDQAARNVACMANMLYRVGRKPNALTQRWAMLSNFSPRMNQHISPARIS